MPAPPSYGKVNPADQPVLYLALTSTILPLSRARRVRRDHDGAAHLDGLGRGAGPGLRPAEVRRPRPARPPAARQPRHRHRRGRRRRAQRQRQPADRNPLRPADLLHGPGQRPDPATPTGYRSGHRDLPQRLAGPRRGPRRRHRQRRERQGRGLVQRRALDLARDLQAARHEHRRGGRGRAQAPADLPEAAAGLGLAPRPLRPVDLDPRLGRGRQVHAAADARARRARDLPLPAQPLGDGHPEPRAAVLDRRHLRRDVRARVQPRQPLAHGPDALGRLRRRRRDRHAREHRPAHRARRGRRSRPRSRAPRRSASRSSR